MRKETAFIIGFLVLTISTSVAIWTFALPNFKPVTFPQVASAVIDVGPMHHQRTLEKDEVVDLNKWLDGHKSGWGPLSRTPPSSGDSHLFLKDAQGKDVLTLTLWTGISAADWNATVFVESPDGSWVRAETFSNKDFAPLRLMVDRYPFKHSSFP